VNQNETLVFIHIPRTGGTTLSKILYHHFPEEARFIVSREILGDRAKLAAMRDEQKRKIRLLFGHLCWGWQRELPQKCQPATVLRDPAVRVISLYSYAKRRDRHYLHKFTASPDYKLDQFIKKGVSLTIDNGMVRQLCGVDRFSDWTDHRAAFNDAMIPYGGVTRAHLEQAKANLRQCAVVGVMERFDDFVRQLHERLELKPIPEPTTYGRINAIAHDIPDQSDWSWVLKHTRLDQELYDYALELIYGR